MQLSSIAAFAGQLLISGLLLLYTALLSPVQICMWNYTDPCNTFPTLRFDVLVDCFFMVRQMNKAPRCPILTLDQLRALLSSIPFWLGMRRRDGLGVELGMRG